MEVWLWLFGAAWVIGLPLLALVLALVALQRAARAERELGRIAGRRRAAEVETQTRQKAGGPRPDAPLSATPAAPSASTPAPAASPPARPEPRPTPPPETPPATPSPSRRGWEERLGARVMAWLGGTALALAGIFLVHYSIQSGWLTPAARVVLGACAGLVCVGLGEIFARRSYHIGDALTAAGVAAIYAAFVAAASLYGLLGPLVALALIALTTIAAVALSLRRGPIVALIGLTGGFVTPALVGATDQSPYLLFGFFLLLQVALLVVVRRRAWWPLPFLSGLGGSVWLVAWLAGPRSDQDAPLLGAFALASCAASVVAALGSERAPRAAATRGLRAGLTFANAGVTLVLVSATVFASGFGPVEWGYLALLAIGAIVLARLDDRFVVLPALTLAVTLGTLASRGLSSGAPGAPGIEALLIGFGTLHVLANVVAHLGRPPRGAFAWTGSLALLAHFVLAWLLLDPRYPDVSFGGRALALALVPAIAAAGHLRRAPGEGRDEISLAAFLVAATTLAALAAPLELEPLWIGVAWALGAAALAWLAAPLRTRTLRVLSAMLLGATFAHLILDVGRLLGSVGDHPLFHAIHVAYGVPLLAGAVAAWAFRRQADEELTRVVEIGAVLLAVAYVGLSIGQGFDPGGTKPVSTFPELGAYGVGWLLLALGLHELGVRLGRSGLVLSGQLVGLAAFAYVLAGPGLIANPLWAGREVGSLALANGLGLAFGVPALLAALMRRRLYRDLAPLPGLIGGGAVWLVFVWTSLEVRRAFHGARLDLGPVADAELYAYSAAWVLLGTVLLAAGIWRRSTTLRFASLAAMLAAVLKVFLYDFRGLDGLLRVSSFLGLGVSLLLLAFLYQRFVFRERDPVSRGPAEAKELPEGSVRATPEA